jgi:copper chaperone NosL
MEEKMAIKRVPVFASIILLTVLLSLPWNSMAAQPVELPDKTKVELSATCPVCDMKLEASTTGIAAVVFSDGKVVGLDGPRDLLVYFLSPDKYGFDPKNIKNIFVAEFGSKKMIDAKKAFFVIGEEVHEGMGPEVQAFSKKEDAEKHKADKNAKNVVAFEEVTMKDVAAKKKILKMKHGH